jgi:hypothetical protein
MTSAEQGFDASACSVHPVSYRVAAATVAEAHYIGRLGSTSVSLGMRVQERLAGVITFGTVPGNNAASICGPDDASAVLELTRLALYGWAPANSESWLIGRSMSWLTKNRKDISIIVSYADASVGHVGTIYQATNWVYTGMSTGDVVYACDGGRVLHPRTVGWDKSTLPPGAWRPSPGKHRYVTFVGSPTNKRALRARLRWPPLPYPKAAGPVVTLPPPSPDLSVGLWAA